MNLNVKSHSLSYCKSRVALFVRKDEIELVDVANLSDSS